MSRTALHCTALTGGGNEAIAAEAVADDELLVLGRPRDQDEVAVAVDSAEGSVRRPCRQVGRAAP